MVPSCQGGDGNSLSSHTHSHLHQPLKLECGNPLMCLGCPGNGLLECALPYLSEQKRTQPLFPQRFSPLSHPPNLAQASWSRCYESKRLEKARAAIGHHLKGPGCPWTPPWTSKTLNFSSLQAAPATENGCVCFSGLSGPRMFLFIFMFSALHF